MKTIALISALAAGLSPVPVLLAQAPAILALNAMPDLAAASAAAPLPEAPAPAVTAVPGFVQARPCRTGSDLKRGPDVDSGDQDREPCAAPPNPYSRFLDTSAPTRLTAWQKATLAARNFGDPANLATVLGTSGYTVGSNAHTAYGPGWQGFRRSVQYSLSQDATGEFFGTFLIPALTRQDPHYRRLPEASVPRRMLHALTGTFLAQSDEGRTIPNYANLITDPICTELSNLYVPGVNGNGPSTVARIMTGYATIPADNLITEFLPDVARRIHVRVILVQRLLNQVSDDQYTLP